MDAIKQPSIELSGEPLTISDVSAVGCGTIAVELNDSTETRTRIDQAAKLIDRAVEEHWSVYGVTTGFGGMANVAVPSDLAAASQQNLLAFLASGAGSAIECRHVRSAMLLRANVLLQGKSGVRFELIERLVRFLQAGALPVVRELGSIGASGDLVPLSTIARAITGHPHVTVNLGGNEYDGPGVLQELGLEPLRLAPKEGLAIVNGTSFSSAVAANCVEETRRLLAVAIASQAMMLKALDVQTESFEAFVHASKPHPGQIWTAEIMRRLLTGGREAPAEESRVQDRYSLRCLPQYLGPVVEGVARVARVIKTEMNAVSDNPLVDSENERFYQSGNFLGQYVGVAMDDLRRCIGLTAKHLDVQIATLVAPEFNQGLPPSLRGNDERTYNMGLKGLQITANSIAPTLAYYGNPIVEHFPTHAEQFNQNINGLSWSSANLCWQSVELFRHYLTTALIFSVQSLDLRARAALGSAEGSLLLGEELRPVYDAVAKIAGHSADGSEPLLKDDSDLWLEQLLQQLNQDLRGGGAIAESVAPIHESFLQSSL